MHKLEYLESIYSISGKRILEVGALDKPTIRKDVANVEYMDHVDTNGLKEKYGADPNVCNENIVSVTHVSDGGNFPTSITSGKKYDLVVASHVLEHIPNPILWLLDIFDVLNEDGRLFLALPDKRFTFDLPRRHTNLSDWIGWFLRDLTKPSSEQVFDHFSKVADVNAKSAWDEQDYTALPRHNSSSALDAAKQTLKSNKYVDAHCSVFTPYSFIELCRELAELDLFPFEIEAIHTTEVFDMEFVVLLKRSKTKGKSNLMGSSTIVESTLNARIVVEKVGPKLNPILHHERPTAEDPRLAAIEVPPNHGPEIRKRMVCPVGFEPTTYGSKIHYILLKIKNFFVR